MTARGLIIAAPHSGAGKTTVTLALLAALRAARHRGARGEGRAGLHRSGIPRGRHRRAERQPRFLGDAGDLLDALAAQAADGAEIFVIEGVMGLFDGAAGAARAGAAPPPISPRISDCRSCWCSTWRGRRSRRRPWCAALRRTIRPCALPASFSIGSRSERHRALVADAIARSAFRCSARVPRDAALALPERHLGLVQAGEHADLAALIDRLADDGRAPSRSRCDHRPRRAAPIARGRGTMPRAAAARPAHRARARSGFQLRLSASHRRLAARRRRDRSVLAARRRTAARAADSCWLPGGYPELHADALAAARRFAAGLRRFAETRPVHGECGGYMVLGESLEDAAGRSHAMTGLLGHATSFAKRKLHLGYRTARLLSDSVLGTRKAPSCAATNSITRR